MISGDPPKESGSRFAFVQVSKDGSGSTSKSMAKSHAMKETLRKKRAGNTDLKPTIQQPYKTARFRLPAPAKPAKGNITSVKKAKSADHSEDDVEEIVRVEPETIPTEIVKYNYIYPVPSSGRLDPFDVMPIAITPRQELLMQYCKSISALIFTV